MQLWWATGRKTPFAWHFAQATAACFPVSGKLVFPCENSDGGFQAVSDLREVSGIGAARYEQLKDLVTV